MKKLLGQVAVVMETKKIMSNKQNDIFNENIEEIRRGAFEKYEETEISERIVIDYANLSGRDITHRAEFRERTDKHLKKFKEILIQKILNEINELAKKDTSDYTSKSNQERQHLIEFIMNI